MCFDHRDGEAIDKGLLIYFHRVIGIYKMVIREHYMQMLYIPQGADSDKHLSINVSKKYPDFFIDVPIEERSYS